MHMLRPFSWLLVALLAISNASGDEILVESAWSRATAPGQDVMSVDLSITSNQSAKLIGVLSDVCSHVELHHMFHENGMMKMREVESIELPAGESVDLRKNGYHLMLMGLKAPLKSGDRTPLTLTIKFADNRVIKVSAYAEVKSLKSTDRHSQEHEHMR